MTELVYPAIMEPRLEPGWSKIAFVNDGTPVRLGSHVETTWRIASALRTHFGAKPDDTFGVLADNSAEYINLWQVAAWGGGTICPINTRLAPAELAYVLKHSSPSVVFVDSAHASVVSELRSELPSIRCAVLMDDGPGACDMTLPALMELGEPTPPPQPNETDPALVMYTGGTTGRPKAVLHTQRSLCLAIHRTHFLMQVCAPDVRLYQPAPLFHIMGMNAALTVPAGGGMSVLRPNFDPGLLIADVAEHRLTHIAAVPTMLAMILAHPSFAPEKLQSLEWIAYGGSAIGMPTLRAYLEQLPRVRFTQSYGMTEAFGSLTGLSAEDHVLGRKLDSVGQTLIGVTLSVQNASGEPVKNGEVGELVARSGSLMQEYRGDPDRTRAVLRDGWYRTGDLGYRDDEGYYFVTDRVDDMIVTGGENVYSSEVEAAIIEHPAVDQVAVIGVPDPTWGKAVHAIVVLNAHAPDHVEGEILASARERIAGYKVPKSIERRREPLPLSGAGKVQKHLLRAEFDARQERDRS